ncbi:hypothetical protein PWEIH_07286 [Listeria weihenstephanensis FSL R9-0317]|uniref:type I toxin-antitoxin system Fst family toxin n=1 Tax=Listeria weihenstephanensis TaxID=1006155 RepID=UPI0003E850FD|nr:hypothetical protein PWEIH_07286 [Listeria weihenstephanensis FSL R9-0317]
MNIFSTILAPVIVGCILAIFNHWLETRRKKKNSRRFANQKRSPHLLTRDGGFALGNI